MRTVMSFILACLLAACAKSGPAPISSGDRYVASRELVETYELGAGDKVHVTVFNEPQLSGDFSVSSDGKISLPLIGDVTVVGKTTAAAAKDIQARLAEGYILDPRVSMEVATYRPFFILGEVRAPGQYPYSSGLTALNAIATAQGYTPRAKKKTVLIRQFGEQYEQEYLVTPNLRVRPGDTLRIVERFF